MLDSLPAVPHSPEAPLSSLRLDGRRSQPAQRPLPTGSAPAVQSFSLVILLRCWRLLTPASAAWLAASLAAAAGDAAWQRRAPRSYAARRELPAAVLRAAAYSLPTTWALMTALLNEHGELPGGMHWAARAAVYACLLAFASGAVKVRGKGWGAWAGLGLA